MSELQPERLTKKEVFITRWLKLRTAVELLAILILSLIIAVLVIKIFQITIPWLLPVITLGLAVIFSPLILPNYRNNCKNYVLIYRKFLYLTMPKKWKRSDVKGRMTQNLNPYSHLANERVVAHKLNKYLALQTNTTPNYFSVIKIKGLNIYNEDAETKENFLYLFANVLKQAKAKISFVKLDEKADYKKNIEFLKQYEKIKYKDEIWEKYYQSVKNDLEMLDNDTIIENYYLIINGLTLNNLYENTDTLLMRMDEIGLEYEILESDKLLEFLVSLNNFKLDWDKYLWFIEHLSQNFNKAHSLDTIFAYDEVRLKKDHLIIDNDYYALNSIAKLPYELDEGWLRAFFNMQGTIIWNSYPLSNELINKYLDKSFVNSLDRQAATNSYSQKTIGSVNEEAISNLIYQINKDNQKAFNTNIYVINKANDYKELLNIKRYNRNLASKYKIKLNDLRYRQLIAMMEAMNCPFEQMKKEAYQMTSLNLGIGYPFIYENYNDDSALLLGKNSADGMPVIFKLFNLAYTNRTNFNMFILGTSGKGKTTFTKKLLVNQLLTNNKVIVIDPQAEYIDLAQKLNGQIIDLGIGYQTNINPLQVRYSVKGDVNHITVLINNHLAWLETYFKMLLNLNDREWILLQQIIKELYESFGIYRLNKLDDIENDKWPLISDLIEFIKKYDVSQYSNGDEKQSFLNEIKEVLSFLFTNNGKYEELFNRPTNINLKNDFVVFNTQNLVNGADDLASKLASMCLLNFVNEIVFNNYLENEKRLNEYRQKTNKSLLSNDEIMENVKFAAVIVDEAHLYIDPDNPAILKYMIANTKTYRKFYAGMIFTTQNPGDFTVNHKVSSDAERIIENSQYAVFFGLKSGDLDKIQNLFRNNNQLLRSEIRFLNDAKKGKCLFALNSNQRIKLNLHYNDIEKELFFKYYGG
ncbi:Mbov_0397 family ICE element conjugal transfer ATPase [Mycoplasmopsis gallinarum]|uniref:Mbov_0397 family ICE element conjugal transfer ATPase n=1 Tax=Mycoplasmopsis gallinarum TaxID=29557 RepID=UPI0004855087|nr:DUF87 domain-containing protein [Mycoplasmopsis gallinarum]